MISYNPNAPHRFLKISHTTSSKKATVFLSKTDLYFPLRKSSPPTRFRVTYSHPWTSRLALMPLNRVLFPEHALCSLPKYITGDTGARRAVSEIDSQFPALSPNALRRSKADVAPATFKKDESGNNIIWFLLGIMLFKAGLENIKGGFKANLNDRYEYQRDVMGHLDAFRKMSYFDIAFYAGQVIGNSSYIFRVILSFPFFEDRPRFLLECYSSNELLDAFDFRR
jgi:hypothetical protein